MKINEQFSAECPANRYDWSEVVDPVTRAQVLEWIESLRADKYPLAAGSLAYRAIKTENYCYCMLGVFAEDRGDLVDIMHNYRYKEFKSASGATATLEDALDAYYFPKEMQTEFYTVNDGMENTEGGLTGKKLATYVALVFGLEEVE